MSLPLIPSNDLSRFSKKSNFSANALSLSDWHLFHGNSKTKSNNENKYDHKSSFLLNSSPLCALSDAYLCVPLKGAISLSIVNIINNNTIS